MAEAEQHKKQPFPQKETAVFVHYARFQSIRTPGSIAGVDVALLRHDQRADQIGPKTEGAAEKGDDTRTRVGSMSKYSAIPPHTPQSIL